MNINRIFLRLFIIFFFALFAFVLAQDTNLEYGQQVEAPDPRFDCSKLSPCQIAFRKDYKEYLDLKYNHKRKLVYHFDRVGYYYFGFNPAKGKGSAFDLTIRVKFNPVVSGNRTIEIGIDTETQSGQVSLSTQGPGKLSWKYLIPETPTLSAIVSGEQILVSADNPVEGGKLYSLNAKTGKLNWFFLTPGAILAYPFLFENFVIVLDDSGNIYWVDKETGNMRFKYTMQEFPVPNPILKDKVLYLATTRGYLHAIKLYDARPAWMDLALVGDIKAMSLAQKGFIIVGANHHWLFNYSNGAKQDKVYE